MIDQFGSTPEGMGKCTNFNFKDRQFTPYTEEDETRLQGSQTIIDGDGNDTIDKVDPPKKYTGEVIDINLLKLNQKSAADTLSKMYTDFKFEASGEIGTQQKPGKQTITITAPNGKTKVIRVGTNPSGDIGTKPYQEEIQKWMQENSVELLPGYELVNGVATKIKT